MAGCRFRASHRVGSRTAVEAVRTALTARRRPPPDLARQMAGQPGLMALTGAPNSTGSAAGLAVLAGPAPAGLDSVDSIDRADPLTATGGWNWRSIAPRMGQLVLAGSLDRFPADRSAGCPAGSPTDLPERLPDRSPGAPVAEGSAAIPAPPCSPRGRSGPCLAAGRGDESEGAAGKPPPQSETSKLGRSLSSRFSSQHIANKYCSTTAYRPRGVEV